MGATAARQLVDYDGRRKLPRPDVAPMQRLPTALLTQGACTTDTSEVFDIDDSAHDPAGAARARAICAACPVAQICLEHALEFEPYGIRGGCDAFERLEMRGAPLPDVAERDAAERISTLTQRGSSAEELAQEYDVSPRSIERHRDKAGLVRHRAP